MKSATRTDAAYEALRHEARALFETSDISNELIAAKLGIGVRTFRALRQNWGWPKRPPMNKRRTLASLELIEPTSQSTGLNAEFVAQLRRELAAIEAMLSKDPEAISPAAAAEKRARTLASLVRSLAEIRQLERRATATGDDENDDFPTTIAELRAELARRLAQLRDAAADGGAD